MDISLRETYLIQVGVFKYIKHCLDAKLGPEKLVCILNNNVYYIDSYISTYIACNSSCGKIPYKNK